MKLMEAGVVKPEPARSKRSVFQIVLVTILVLLSLFSCVRQERNLGRSEKFIQELSHRDPVVRRNAADALGRLGDIHAVEALITALKDPDPSVRRGAAGAL